MIEPELPHSPVRRYVSAPCPGSPTKKSDPKNPECEEVSEKSGSSSGDNGFRGLLKGRFRAPWRSWKKMTLSEKKSARSDANGCIFLTVGAPKR